MEFLEHAVLVLHFIGLAGLLGSFLVQMRPPRSITMGYLHGSITMLVTGVLLVGLNYALDEEVNNQKITVKLAILLVIFGLVLANRKKPEISTGVWAAIGGLAITNIVLAVFW
jgi:heme A synthase